MKKFTAALLACATLAALATTARAVPDTHDAALTNLLKANGFMTTVKSDYWSRVEANQQTQDPHQQCIYKQFDNPATLAAIATAIKPRVSEADARLVTAYYQSGANASTIPAATRKALQHVNHALDNNNPVLLQGMGHQLQTLVAQNCQ